MPTATAAETIAYTDLVWSEIIPDFFKADYLGISIEIDICEESNWAVYDVRGDLWLEGFCHDLADGKVKAFNALKSEIS
ncbi:MAG: hypothetical protein DCF15_05860 [Phormidesmis priestleyi]|uniref:Uncharacterized protein n=1 Tax=Phormidesmis priestleyi TaxID=268141 RepID=A0A2W4XKU5_9CYAN|nr:MAG: hypothetical protein DCF15_05860 [Phormidesmis priestleyi]